MHVDFSCWILVAALMVWKRYHHFLLSKIAGRFWKAFFHMHIYPALWVLWADTLFDLPNLGKVAPGTWQPLRLTLTWHWISRGSWDGAQCRFGDCFSYISSLNASPLLNWLCWLSPLSCEKKQISCFLPYVKRRNLCDLNLKLQCQKFTWVHMHGVLHCRFIFYF